MINYYHRFISNCSQHLAPFHDLLAAPKDKVEWTPELEQAFTSVKNAVQQECILKFPNAAAPLRLVTDASDVGVGTILEQFEAPF